MKVHQRGVFKVRTMIVIGLSALFVAATGCGADKPAGPASSGADSSVESSSSIVSETPSSSIFAPGESLETASGAGEASSKKSASKNTSPALEVSGKSQNDSEWVAYDTNKDNYKLHIRRKDGIGDKVVVNDIVLAPCVAGAWVYYLSSLDEIDKVKLDGSQKTKVCDTDAMQHLNGNMAITAEYKDGYILYQTKQCNEAGNNSSYPTLYYKLDLKQNKLIPSKNQL